MIGPADVRALRRNVEGLAQGALDAARANPFDMDELLAQLDAMAVESERLSDWIRRKR